MRLELIVRLLPVLAAIVRGGLVWRELLPKRGDDTLLLPGGDEAEERCERKHL